ncbi:MAG: hypothetical protein IPM21_13600 [Acidobacteria bacterium]|nr:hypothetical protein [Acidobacteriota bacterium]
MKNLILNALSGRNTRSNGLIALAFISLIVLGCNCNRSFDLGNAANTSSGDTETNTSRTTSTSDSNVPSDALIEAMVKETLADFNLAVTTDNWTGIYEKASTDFQSTFTEAQMKNTFKDFVKNRRAVTPIISEALRLDPEYTQAPYIRNEKGLDILVVDGKFPTKRVPTNFEFEYVKRSGDWKMLKLVVKLQ